MKSVAKEEKKMQKISGLELKEIQKLAESRNQLAIQLGSITYEYECTKINLHGLINKIAEEQRVLGTLFIKNAGFDPSSKNCSIDIQTGEITEQI